MRNRRAVFDRFDVQASRLQRRDSAFSPRSRTFDSHFDILDAEFHRSFGRLLGRTLTGERCTLATSLELAGPSTRPAQRIATRVSDRDDRIVECRFDMSDRDRDVTTRFSFLTFCHSESLYVEFLYLISIGIRFLSRDSLSRDSAIADL